MTVQPIAHVEFPLDNDVLGFPRAFLVFAMLVGVVAVVTGHPVVAPTAIVALLVVAAAVVDEQVGRIPNRLTSVALATLLVAVPFMATQGRPLESVASSVLAGILISGAPVLFLIWLFKPDLIGGGDWKLLAVIGASLGLISPIGAALAALVACLVQFVRLTLRRRRSIPFAPGLAVGYGTALMAMPLLTSATGGAL